MGIERKKSCFVSWEEQKEYGRRWDEVCAKLKACKKDLSAIPIVAGTYSEFGDFLARLDDRNIRDARIKREYARLRGVNHG